MAGDSKTEKATPKRRQDERKKGNVLTSKDVITISSLIGTFFSLKLLFPTMVSHINTFIIKCFDYAQSTAEISQTFVLQISRDMIFTFVAVVMPIMAISILCSIAATVAQTKPLFVLDALKPKFSKLNPIEGFKKLFSLKSLFDVIKGILKISVLVVILYNYVTGSVITLARTLDGSINNSISIIFDLILGLVFKVCLAFLAVAVFDYFFQWWEFERQMKMSKHELKEEYKQMEGDPQIKSKIKEIQRRMAMSRMMQEVQHADVVIKNPTHFAVALKYDIEKDNAPILLAKGQDEVALRIIKEAEAHDIYILENKPLARAIYSTTDLNREIPAEFYGTVAEILVYVYKIKNKKLK